MQIRKAIISLLVVATFLLATGCQHARLSDDLTQDEVELVRLIQDWRQADRVFSDNFPNLEDLEVNEAWEVRNSHIAENDPAKFYTQQLIDFEAKHRGTDVGFYALYQIVTKPVNTFEQTYESDARRSVFDAFRHYADRPSLMLAMERLDGGHPEPQTESMLRGLIDWPETSEQNRLFARYMLARWSIAMHKRHSSFSAKISTLQNGRTPYFRFEPMRNQAIFDALPEAGHLDQLVAEAYRELEVIATSDSVSRSVAGRWREGTDHVIWEVESEVQSPLIRERAEGLLFKEKRLARGQTAPPLDLTLIDGQPWRLTDHHGKVVVIMFSFKGCGPCERMYPELRKLYRDHGSQIEILNIMSDRDRADTVKAHESGKLPWSVVWDGRKGPLKTRFGVRSYPTTYVVGRDGKIAAEYATENTIRPWVESLLKTDS